MTISDILISSVLPELSGVMVVVVVTVVVFIWLKAGLQLNIGFTLWPVLMVFTRAGITLPKVNGFG